MIHNFEVLFHKIRKYFSLSKWMIRLFNLPLMTDKYQDPGLILVQIDALSRCQLEKALDAKKMPFLRNLLKKQNYKIHTEYAGMPPSTPAVQGEIFYGEPRCVPSFSFYIKDIERECTLFNPIDARMVEEKLQENHAGLFEQGGSCYSNIFTGNAAEAHFCISDLTISRIFINSRRYKFLIAALLNIISIFKAAILLVIEFILAVIDFFRGIIAGRDFLKELVFIPSRVALCILLRERIVVGAKMDIIRGLPVIHLNLMGYHDQSHRRGATSRFAQWTLKGIDSAIKRIYVSSQRSEKHYDLWVYSDHGQVDTLPYRDQHGVSIQQAVEQILTPDKEISDYQRAPVRRSRFFDRIKTKVHDVADTIHQSSDEDRIIVTSLGPMAHIYLNTTYKNDMDSAVDKLNESDKIPCIMIPVRNGEELSLRVLTQGKEYSLPADNYFFDNDFVPHEVVEDLVKACHHIHAGDLILSGYQGVDQPYFSFAQENGSHGGITENEYRGFFIAPLNCSAIHPKEYYRPSDIRESALRFLDACSGNNISTKESQNIVPSKTFKIMSYNVHSCVGMDGRLSPERIAAVISQYNPDIVALQELDVGRYRSGHTDQAKIVAELLKMNHFFSPAIAIEEEQYGDAIYSRYPMQLLRMSILPGYKANAKREPRGAIMVQIKIGDRDVFVINTHLGLNIQERKKQIESLLGKEWFDCDLCMNPAILCGDFNFGTQSPLYRKCSQNMKVANPDSAPFGTYCGRFPLIRLDHIFYKNEIELKECKIGDSMLARMASDHRPVIAEFKFS